MENKHWIQGDTKCQNPVFRREFTLEELPESGKIAVCGLGYFLLYVNGERVGNQEFVPALTNYTSVLGNKAAYPVWEERTKYKSFYLTYDILPYIKKGKNVIGIQLGNGWYRQERRKAEGEFVFGNPKVRYEISLKWKNGNEKILESDSQTLWREGEVVENNIFCGEVHDLRRIQDDWCSAEASLKDWKKSQPVHAPETVLEEQTCPSDRVLRKINPVILWREGNRVIFDCQENIAGWVTVRCKGKAGEKIRIRHSEEITKDRKNLDFESAGGKQQIQEQHYICDGTEREVHPKFCWHAFRYFEVEGPGEVESVSLVCTEVVSVSAFQCSDPVLNWLYEAYIRTQINNYHNCIPSDCPHRERLGYTGDGQLTSETAMLLLDTKKLYEKWYQDILDSQGADTGHIPHTAPFFGGGGGPGGWGGAVYIVPWNAYKVYGDISLLQMGYPAIIKWLNYMESRCEAGIVVQEEEGGWCLGDWCMPEDAEGVIPPAFVNTYYYIEGLRITEKIAALLNQDRPEWLEQRRERSINAFTKKWFNPETGDFCGGIGAANAFALNLGLGNEKTKENLVRRYERLGKMDTGIFGTPVLLERLFEEGEAELAFRLMTSKSDVSYYHMMAAGATTLWERWDGKESHDHPMFGSVVKLLFTEILGIRQSEESVGYRSYEIRPADIPQITWAKGKIETVNGVIEVNWRRDEQGEIKIL